MNVHEAKQLLASYLLQTIASYGYKEKKAQTGEFQFVSSTPMGTDTIIGGFTSYYLEQQVIYSVSKSNKHINHILLELQESGIPIRPPVKKDGMTLGFGYNSLHGIHNKLDYLPIISTEIQMKSCVEMMAGFLVDTAFPLMKQFEDLREIDKIINGNEPWVTDWQMPYVLGGHFYEKRMILAKLAGNPRFDELADLNYKAIERLSAEGGNPFQYDRNDMSKKLPRLLKILEQVKSLY